ncbi:hypothetical protein EVAR_22793_1 [Eumeta japonica]|uniref:Uncharacterized protein n=1 Tax=Eumeta variegata TaxID=151549 RepID=A0A4C1VFC5_EUMVA|nr:hypothetical protein EVAR_22793_1 [Eumeta japonica]
MVVCGSGELAERLPIPHIRGISSSLSLIDGSRERNRANNIFPAAAEGGRPLRHRSSTKDRHRAPSP